MTNPSDQQAAEEYGSRELPDAVMEEVLCFDSITSKIQALERFAFIAGIAHERLKSEKLEKALLKIADAVEWSQRTTSGDLISHTYALGTITVARAAIKEYRGEK